VPQRKTEPVLSGFGKNGSKGVCGEVLELINVEVEISPVPFPGVRPLHGGELKLRDEERAQQPAVLFPDLPLREVPDEDAPFVHGSAKVDRAGGLSQDVPHQGRCCKLAHLILNRRDDERLICFMKRRELLSPESFHNGVLYPQEDLVTELRIGEQSIHAEKGRMVVEEKRGKSVVHDVLHPAGAPHIAPDAFQS